MPQHFFGLGQDSFVLPFQCFSVGTSDIVMGEAVGALPQIGVGEAWETLSASANDTAAGTGARKIKVIGFKSGAMVTEEITMNGVAAVATAELTWSGQIIAAFVSEAGSGKVNAGDITIRKAAAGGDRLKVLAGRMSAYGGMYVVPTGKQLIVRGGQFRGAALPGATDSMDVRLCANHDPDTNVASVGNIMIPFANFNLGNGGEYSFRPTSALVFPAGTTMALIGKASAGTTGRFAGYLDVLLANAA